MAAAGGAPPYPNPPQGPTQSGAPPYPGNQQYQAYRPPQPQSSGQPGYGAPYQQPPSQQSYAAPPTQVNPAVFKQSLQQTIQEKNIQNLFQNPSILDQICQVAPAKVDQLCQYWRVPREIGQDMVKLALFDIVLYIDDSGSMQFEENGERIQDLKLILAKVAYAASLFDSDGIQVRFMNSDKQGNNIRTQQEVESLIAQIQFKGLTPMGTQLRNKVLEPLVIRPAKSNQLQKPVLVITITDGQPAGEPQGAVFDAIKYASDELARTRYGKGAISFQFAQVGNDLKAREFLGKLDSEPGIGDLVDCTSNFEVEQDEMSRAQPPVDLTPDLWLVKLLLGAVDSSYDTQDETGGRPAGGAPPGQYGAPPPQPGYYGQPPQGQYGAPPPQNAPYGQAPQYGAPPTGQYGQAPQYGAPPQQGYYNPPSQGHYGASAPQYGQQQGGYPGQQQYKPPPPPPRY